MNKHYLFLLLLGHSLLFFSAESNACGYAWVSDCSSQVHLRINGTLDSFNIADCPSGYAFDGLQLGSLQSLTLANAKTITWESCQNNVSGVQLRYRVYESGFPGGTWQSSSLQQYFETLEGPYTTRYRSNPMNISLTAGLTLGKTYTVELYLLAEVDTIGDDFIPETTFLRDNNGANYKLTFIYGGPSASPILLLPHLTKPSCFGGNNGNIAVIAYGNLAGVFYHWSNVNLNFYQQYDMSAGTYSITVTNASGTSVSDTFTLGQPAVLQTTFNNIQSLGCNSTPGAATAVPSGGSPPYQFMWENGQQSATATVSTSANWHVTVTDSHQCSTVASVFIDNTGQIERMVSASLCAGQTYTLSGHSFNIPGVYTFTVPGSGGCDTIIQLTLQQSNLTSALSQLPSNILLTCANPTSTICAAEIPNANYTWEKNGLPILNEPCLSVVSGGVYSLTIEEAGCAATKSINADEHLQAAPVQVYGSIVLFCNSAAPAWLVATSNATNPSYTWVYDGLIISVKDSCLFQVTAFNGGFPVLPTLSVSDAYGCQNSNPDWNIVFIQNNAAPQVVLTALDASSTTASDGSVSLNISGGQSPYAVDWSNGGSGLIINNLVPGTYCVTVVGANGCSSTACAEVSAAVASWTPEKAPLRFFPNPAVSGTSVAIELPEIYPGQTTIELFDANGKKYKYTIMENPDRSFLFHLPSDIPEGLHFIRIRTGSHCFSGKLFLR